MTAEELKALLSTPAALFVLMICASLGSALKQMMVANRQDVQVTFRAYFLKHWPETLIMLGSNAGAFVGLIMTDSLNWAAAIGIGYLANDAADAFTPKGRSAQVQGGDRQSGYARVAFLALVSAVAGIMLLSACANTPVDVIKPACTTTSKYQVERCVKAWGETYEIYQKRALEFVSNPSAPRDAVTAVKDAERLASGAVIELQHGGAEFIRIREEVTAGKTAEEQLAIATANLDRYIATVDERIEALVRALSGRS